eukprot:321435-Pleurochrysis_carterae.AAC.1
MAAWAWRALTASFKFAAVSILSEPLERAAEDHRKADALRLVLKRAKGGAPRASEQAALDAHAAALRATPALPVLTAAVSARESSSSCKAG